MTDQLTSTDTGADRADRGGHLVHIVTLACKDAERAQQCLDALERHGRPDARQHGCCSYDFGLELGSADRIRLIERWNRWEDLDTLLVEKVVPALPMYDELLAAPFDPATDTVRVELA